ncbi:MAG TPA: hypothetical protein VFD01_02530 [Candidatus Dormibacteraeota bacterium]|nr:hypothetical protein [Candidatus Dormibacteraeota bacterium]
MRPTLAALAAALLTACSGGAGHPSPVATPVRGAPTPMACAPAQTPASAPGLASPLPLVTLASGLDQPDDLLWDGGLLLVGEYRAGRIAVLGDRGGPRLLPGQVPEVEGLARLGGDLYAADQLHDRVVRVAADGTVTPVVQLQPVPGVEGVDGIASDGSRLLVPDSARGRLLFVGPDGRVERAVGSFLRPTGAWPMPDGSVLVADENAGRVQRLTPDGGRTVLASGIGLVDDVAAAPGGAVYAIGISRGVLVQISDGAARDLVTGFREPQGLTLDGAGNPIVGDLQQGRVVAVVASFLLLPAGPPPRLRPGQPLCVDLVRAPGFTDPIDLRVSAPDRVLSQPGSGSRGEVLPGGACGGVCWVQVGAVSGGRSGTVWLPYSR